MIETGLWHKKAIQDLVSHLKSDHNVLALARFGSIFHSPANIDIWSDVDIFMVVEDESIDQYYPNLDWLKSLGTIYTHDQSHNTFYRTSRICFDDLRRLDIVITTSSNILDIQEWARNPLSQGFNIVFSKAGWIEEALAKINDKSQLTLVSLDDFQEMVDEFWFKGVLAVYKVARNDLLTALHLALDMVQDCCVLGMILRDRTEGVSFHKEGGLGNEFVTQISSTNQPYTESGILDMV